MGAVCDRDGSAVFPVEAGKHGLPEAVCPELPSQGWRPRTGKDAHVEAVDHHCVLGGTERYAGRAVSAGCVRCRYSDSGESGICRMRYDLHFVVLPVPYVGAEKQVLHDLPHLQLGLRHDFHPADFYSQRVYLYAGGVVGCAADQVGSDGGKASGAFCREQQCMPRLQKLPGKAMPAQKAAAELSEKVAEDASVNSDGDLVGEVLIFP